ncbi:hypothetical protein, partial [Halobacterium bonnevillei]|uniref:hypothetical protein n=1 Tax=Halobacterium bonnevillei TaxID=2692200 RepID=UPI001F397AFD
MAARGRRGDHAVRAHLVDALGAGFYGVLGDASGFSGYHEHVRERAGVDAVGRNRQRLALANVVLAGRQGCERVLQVVAADAPVL